MYTSHALAMERRDAKMANCADTLPRAAMYVQRVDELLQISSLISRCRPDVPRMMYSRMDRRFLLSSTRFLAL